MGRVAGFPARQGLYRLNLLGFGRPPPTEISQGSVQEGQRAGVQDMILDYSNMTGVGLLVAARTEVAEIAVRTCRLKR